MNISGARKANREAAGQVRARGRVRIPIGLPKAGTPVTPHSLQEGHVGRTADFFSQQHFRKSKFVLMLKISVKKEVKSSPHFGGHSREKPVSIAPSYLLDSPGACLRSRPLLAGQCTGTPLLVCFPSPGGVLTLATVGPAARGRREWSLSWSPVRVTGAGARAGLAVPGVPYMPSLKEVT